MDDRRDPEMDEMRSLELEDIGQVVNPDDLPVTTSELVERFGDRRVRYPRGSESLGAILETSGEETYETMDEVELAIFNGVGRDAVGRPRYSDRGDEVPQELDRMDQSF